MKHSFYFLAASIGILAACSGFEKDVPVDAADDEEISKVIFNVQPVIDDDAIETKASAVPQSDYNLNFAWEETDRIGIFPNKGSQIYFEPEDGVGTNSASFDGGGWALKPNSSYISYYPFVADFDLDRNVIPISFANQKQKGTEGPFNGEKWVLATNSTTSQNGILTFEYSILNTIINVIATLPAGTYTSASLNISEPLFAEEATFSLDEKAITGSTFSKKMEIELEDFTLASASTVPIYFMAAPVDLTGKEITVIITKDDGSRYKCVKTPSGPYNAGSRRGLTCEMQKDVPVLEAIDLGLPSGLKWASFNLGASKPEEYGDYFAWGETQPYYSSQDPLTWKDGKNAGYAWASYMWCMGSWNTMTKYCSYSDYGYNGFTDNKTILDLEDDAAYVNLGGNWRMPTNDEFTELREKCTLEWTQVNGINGGKFTGPNGNSIFLPAAGYRPATGLYYAGSVGQYWSSSLKTDNYPYSAYGLNFNSGGQAVEYVDYRYYGYSVRPVSE